MFMAFLQEFENAVKVGGRIVTKTRLTMTRATSLTLMLQKQGLLIAANLAVGGGVLAGTAVLGPNTAVSIGAFAVHSTIEAGRRVYTAKKYDFVAFGVGCQTDSICRHNTYLHDMNEQVFKPRCLYALILEYNPDSQEATEIVDLDTDVAKSAAKDGATGSYFTISSSTTHGEVQMPIAAPLTFPDLEYTTTTQKENAFKLYRRLF